MTTSRFFVTDIEVAAERNAATLVVLGDSTSDGTQSTTDRNGRWPDALADRLQADPNLASISVANAGIAGIAGNRILHDGPIGPSALARLERDAIGKPGTRWILLLEGINDISGSPPPGLR